MKDPVRIEIMKHLFSSVAEEWVFICVARPIRRISKNDVIFPVQSLMPKADSWLKRLISRCNLGAMPLSVQACLAAIEFAPNDVAIVNNPYQGGTHLPDITMVSPIFVNTPHGEHLMGFVANRAHHADVGGMSPGSMPLSQELFQEGIIIPPLKLVSGGVVNQELWKFFLANVRTPIEREGDLHAQIGATQTGIERILGLVTRYGADELTKDMEALILYSERMTRRLIAHLPNECTATKICWMMMALIPNQSRLR